MSSASHRAERLPVVASTERGEPVVAWIGSDQQAWARKADVDLDHAGPAQRVADRPIGNLALTAYPGGSLLMLAGDDGAVSLVRLDGRAAPMGSARRIGATPTPAAPVGLAAWMSGHVAAAWRGPAGVDGAFFSTLVSAEGAPPDGTFHVDAEVLAGPAATPTLNGGLWVTWADADGVWLTSVARDGASSAPLRVDDGPDTRSLTLAPGPFVGTCTPVGCKVHRVNDGAVMATVQIDEPARAIALTVDGEALFGAWIGVSAPMAPHGASAGDAPSTAGVPSVRGASWSTSTLKQLSAPSDLAPHLSGAGLSAEPASVPEAEATVAATQPPTARAPSAAAEEAALAALTATLVDAPRTIGPHVDLGLATARHGGVLLAWIEDDAPGRFVALRRVTAPPPPRVRAD